MHQIISRVLLVTLVTLSAACSTVDFDADKPVSHALTDTGDTYIGKYLSKYSEHPPDESGFHVVTDSIDALGIRLVLAEKAERSIDAQYYMVGNDIIGNVFFASLLRAADRGVRVRLLMDDINTGGMEDKLAGMDAHPNIELRLFNPFANRGVRALDAWDFGRINRRMHNKSFTVDNQITIIGGRNIANEYFAANPDYNFGDLDTVAIGPVVADTSQMFDAYWNHRNAIPYQQLAAQNKGSEEQLAALRELLRDHREALRDTPYAAAVYDSLDDYRADYAHEFYWATYQLIYDSPDKSIGSDEAEHAASIMTPLLQSARSAQESLLIISPYFVPRSRGIKALGELQDSGVQIDIVTNSLASSDHLLVYGGYAGCRKPLLRHGVRFFEARHDEPYPGAAEVGADEYGSSLHTKAFVVDGRYFFMGSFNWDPRSAEINTELGILIDSPDIAGWVADRVYAATPSRSYEVFLSENGNLRWRTVNEGKEVVFDKEPATSFFTRLKGNLSRALPMRGQL
jgi:cardiolipin synthase C